MMNTATLALFGLVFLAVGSGMDEMRLSENYAPMVVEASAHKEGRHAERMCLAYTAHADVCRREVRRIDRDFAYKWPVLFLYLDAKRENRPLTIGYIVELRAQLANISRECATRQRLQKIIRAIDVQFAMFILRLQGHEAVPALDA